MTTSLRAYDPERDFLAIRQFLVDTFALYERPFNWLIDHWNFCRYHALPLHTYYNTSCFGVPTGPRSPWRDELPAWERAIGVWENERGEIVGVVNTENEEPGEAWVQIHPDYTHLYDEMVTFAEERLADRVGGVGYVKLYVNEGTELERIASRRGYRKLNAAHTWLEYRIDETPTLPLPDGFVVRSVLEEDDVEKRRIAKAVAFGAHYGPTSWPPAAAFREMQRAPDYRKDLDLFVVAPNGDYASFCTIWVDERNGYANFEPVGTRAEYQGMGLARALMLEGFRRMALHGARRSFMEANPHFYRRIGFRETPWSYGEWVKYFAV